MDVYAMILAAGTSSRMGQPKQLLPLGEYFILEHVIHRVLEGPFTKVAAVIGHEAAAIQESIHIEDRRFQWIINKNYHLGKSSSLICGLESFISTGSNVMVFLGDLPFISDETVHTLYESGMELFSECGEPFIVRPVYKEVPGHPVFFGQVNKGLFDDLGGDQGAKAIIERFTCRKHLIVEDEGVLLDVDTPEAYKEAKKRNRKYG
ncbi:nucleotidyltransferase family protein [Bacillus sp. B190/17]|uniref:Nucleotidyltransferase family protein n=1 Tax=Bacillus lumedeiriae TaxID=3058829 RepID=A0ABW8I985_9BACI